MRRMTVAVIGLLALALVATPALAQSVISAQNPSFSWTGKQDQQANFTWSATLTNPSKRTTTVVVTLQLIDASGNVVGADTKTVTLQRESDMEVGGDASIAYADAARAAQYRVMVEGADES